MAYTHDPQCVLSEPCDEEEPNHGYCGFTEPRYCIHCDQWCICDRLAKVRADEREKCEREFSQRVAAGIRSVLQWRAREGEE